MHRVRSLLVWFVLLEGLWLVLVGTRQTTELVAGLVVAAAGVLFVEVLRVRGHLSYVVAPQLVGRVPRVALGLVLDFLVVTRVLIRCLAHGRRVRGVWLTVPYPVPEGPAGRGERAFAALAGTATPNGIVVDLDRGQALLHSLDADVRSGREVLS